FTHPDRFPAPSFPAPAASHSEIHPGIPCCARGRGRLRSFSCAIQIPTDRRAAPADSDVKVEVIGMATLLNGTPLEWREGEQRRFAERLERGAVIHFPVCPFLLPTGEDHDFLLEQKLGKGHKNISYDPQSGQVGGYAGRSPERTE